MTIIVVAAFLSAVGLGAYLLMPHPRSRMILARSKLAVTHGLLGALGFAGYIWMLYKGKEEASLLVWTAVSLVTIGLGLGIAIYLIPKYRPASDMDLILTSHVILAGMGALIIAGLVLI